MAVVVTQGNQVGLSISMREAQMVLSLIGRTADGTLADLYEDMFDAGIPAMKYAVIDGSREHVGVLYLEEINNG